MDEGRKRTLLIAASILVARKLGEIDVRSPLMDNAIAEAITATHEDIRLLVDQVSHVTTATKEIEAKISHEMWDQQKRWELKRKTLFDLTKRLSDVKFVLLTMYGIYQTDKTTGAPRFGERARSYARVHRVSARLEEAISLLKLTSSNEALYLDLMRFLLFSAELAEQIAAECTEGFSAKDFSGKWYALAVAIAEEMKR
jgi:hypothetical protein